MIKCAGILTLVLFASFGCATVAPTLKDQPKKFESEAKEALTRLSQDAKGHIDLRQEDVWLRKDSVVIRTSWKDTGGVPRRTDFTFRAASPVVLTSIEGENPFHRPPH